MNQSPCFPSLFYKQRLNAAGIFMLCGVLLYLLFPGAAPYCLLFASFLLFIVALFCKGEKRKIVICFSLGFCLALFSVSFCQIKGALLEKYQGETVLAEGYVTKADEDSFDLSLVSLDEKGAFALVRCSGNGPKQGEKIKISLKMLALYPVSCRSEGIDFLAEAEENYGVVGKSHLFSFVSFVRSKLISAFGEGETGGFLSAILLGERSGLTDGVKEDFRITASSHILAISGLHITQFLGILYCLFRVLSVDMRFGRFLLYPLVLVLYLLGGAGVSVFRASLMALFSLTAVLLRRRNDSVTSLVFSAVLLVFFDPFTLENLSFIFSYVSTFALLCCALPLCDYLKERFFSEKEFGFFTKPLLALFSSLCISLVVYVFLLPFQLMYFGQVQVLSPLYALILIPLFEPVLMIALILGVLAFFPWFFSLLSPFLFGIVNGFLRLVHMLAEGSFYFRSSEQISINLAIFITVTLAFFFIRKVRIVNLVFLYLLLSVLLGLFSLISL